MWQRDGFDVVGVDLAHANITVLRSHGLLGVAGSLALTITEMTTAAGFIDICVVDTDGQVTVVECKLASNSEKRRMVIGRVVDYAAALWRGGEDAFFAQLEHGGGPPLAEVLSPSALSALRLGLAEGRINLCLAVDQIDGDIRRLVEFLNRITRPDVSVTAIQLSYARDGDVEVLIPTTFGGEIADAKRPASSRRETWTVESFPDALPDPADRALAEWLFEQLAASEVEGAAHPLFWFGARPGRGVFLHPGGVRFAPLQLWVNKAGELRLYGNWRQYESVREHDGFAPLAALLGQDHRGPQRSVAATAGHAYEYHEPADDVADAIEARHPNFSGCYRLHRSLPAAIRRLRLWEMGPGGLTRSFPPHEWSADPDDLALGSYQDGARFAWISAHAVALTDTSP